MTELLFQGITPDELRSMIKDVVMECLQAKNDSNIPEDKVYTREDAAKYLRMSPQWLSKLSKEVGTDLIPSRRGRRLLYKKTVLDNYLEKRKIQE